jgi:hypothetical protein
MHHLWFILTREAWYTWGAQIVYKTGKTNVATGALSRVPIPVLAVSEARLKWLEVIVDWYMQDAPMKQLYTELTLHSPNDKWFSLTEGVIRYQGKIWLGTHTVAQQAFLLALHSSGLGGHSGGLVTYHKIKQLFT